jgi:hypothetical protein
VCGTSKLTDLVIAAPGKTVNSAASAGAVFIIYSTDSGLTASSSQMWTQDSSGIADLAEQDDEFGYSIATGHSYTGRDYLVIGVPFEDIDKQIGPITDAGVIHILKTDGTTGVVTASGSKLFHQDTPGIKDTAERGDKFGFSVATGNFNAEVQDDLVVGVPYEDLNGLTAVGAINVLYEASTANTQFLHQNSIDVKDTEEPFDHFGFALSRD